MVGIEKYKFTIILFSFGIANTLSGFMPQLKHVSILFYIPFFAIYLYGFNRLKVKIENSLEDIQIKAGLLNIILIIYFIILFLYRVMRGLNYRDSFSFAIFLFAISFVILSLDNFSPKIIVKNISLFQAIIVLMYGIQIIFFNGDFRQSKILLNVMITACILIACIPLNFYLLYKNEYTYFWKVISIINQVFTFTFCVTIGSRSAVLVFFLVFIGSILIYCREKRMIKYIILIILFSAAFVFLLIYTQGETIVINIFRQFDFLHNAEKGSFLGKFIEVVESEQTQFLQESAKGLVDSSQEMRKDLLQRGINEIKSNPIWGSGNYLFDTISNDIKIRQSAHNFLIDTVNSFGFIGLLVYSIILSMQILPFLFLHPAGCKRWLYMWREKLSFVLSIGSVFTISMVQPLMSSPMVILVTYLLIGFYQKIIQSNSIVEH